MQTATMSNESNTENVPIQIKDQDSIQHMEEEVVMPEKQNEDDVTDQECTNHVKVHPTSNALDDASPSQLMDDASPSQLMDGKDSVSVKSSNETDSKDYQSENESEVGEKEEEEVDENEVENEEEEYDDDEASSSLLSPSMIIKCFVVAVIASSISVMQLNGGSGVKRKMKERRNQRTNANMKSGSSRNDMSNGRYSKRASNLDFCRNETKVYNEGECLSPSNISSLKLMDFNMPSNLVDFVVENYELEHYPEQKARPVNTAAVSDYGDVVLQSHKTAPKFQKARAYVHLDAPVSSYYRLADDDDDEVYSKKVSPSFTGFAGKFINLSPHPVLFYWDGPSPLLLDKIMPFESVGTATFPGHQFYLTSEYDSSHVLKRFFITSDTKVMVYDTKLVVSSLTAEQRVKYLAQLANLEFARDYLVTTKRHWLGMFPRPLPKHHMWDADYFFQEHVISTRETHFVKTPSDKELSPIYFEGEYSSAGSATPRPLTEYRSSSDSMNLTLKVISCAPRVFEIDNFLSDVEVDHILSLATGLTRSTVDGESSESDDTRTSTNTWVERHASPIIDSIYRRAADLTRIDERLLRYQESGDGKYYESIAESLQLVHYDVGQEYTPHHDFSYPPALNTHQSSRFATILLYLNDDVTGGETVFPRAINSKVHSGLQVKPQKGKAILFYNMLPDGNMDDLSQHASYPVKDGEKWLANLWLWDPVMDTDDL